MSGNVDRIDTSKLVRRVRRRTFHLLVAGAVAATLSGVPAAALALPLPVPTMLPEVLPTLAPTQVAVPAPVPTVAPSVAAPVGALGSGAPTVGAPTGDVTAPTGAAAPVGVAPSATPFVPSPEERQALPDEPERIAYEAQQLDVFDQLASIDPGLLARLHLDGGGGGGMFGWPVAVDGRPPITQRFGCSELAGEPFRSDCPSHRWHTGIDLADRAGTPVYAAADGVARVVASGAGYGNYILLAHGGGYSTLYGHLAGFAVPDGAIVTRGQLIGVVGSTGFSTGAHLHFEVRFERDYLDPCAELSC